MNKLSSNHLKEISCPTHKNNPIEYFNFAQGATSEERIMCQNCNLQNTIRVSVQETYLSHKENYEMCENRTVFQQDIFFLILDKQFRTISDRLKDIAEKFETAYKDLLKMMEDFKQKLIEHRFNLFNIENVEQLKLFAENYYKLYYSKDDQSNETILESLQSKVEQIDEDIKTLYDQSMEELSNNMVSLDSDFRRIENIIQTKILQKKQIKNAIFGSFETQFLLQDQFSFLNNENNCYFLIKEEQRNNLQILQFDSKRKPSFQLQIEQILNYNDIMFCCVHEKLEWIVIARRQLNECLLFWRKNVVNQNISFVLEKQIDVNEQVKHLEIDQEHNCCFSFHEKTINIWKYDRTWQLHLSIECSDFKSVQFKDNYSLFVVQNNISQSSVFFYEILNNEQQLPIQGKCQEITFLSEKDNFKIDQIFFSKHIDKEKELIIIFSAEELIIYEVDLKHNVNQFRQVWSIILQEGKISFCSQTNIFSLMNKEKQILMLYKLEYSGTIQQRFSIHIISQIHSILQFVNAQFSKNSKFLALSEKGKRKGPTLTYHVNIYSLKHLPQINRLLAKIPKIQFC